MNADFISLGYSIWLSADASNYTSFIVWSLGYVIKENTYISR